MTSQDHREEIDATGPQLIGAVDPKRLRLLPVVSRLGLGDRLRQLSVVLGKHRDVCQRGGLLDRVLFLHDQPPTSSADRCRVLDN